MGRLKRMCARGALLLGALLTISGCEDTTLLAAIRQLSQGPPPPQWARTLTAGDSTSKFFSTAIDSAGNLYVAGYIVGSGSYGFGNGVSAQGTSAGNNALIAKYSSSGTALWAQTVTSGASDSLFYSVAVDNSGNVYAAGYISGTGSYEWGGVTVSGTNSAGLNAVVVKYAPSGAAQWARSVTAGANDSSFRCVKTDPYGNIYAAGSMVGPTLYNFGGATGTATGVSATDNAVLVKYNTAGTAQWARTATSGDHCKFYNIAADSSGNLYVVGFIYGTTSYDFGNGVTATGTAATMNAVLVKYNSAGTAQWYRAPVAGALDSAFWSVALDPSGNIYASGYVTNIGSYDFGNGATVAGTSTSGNAVLVKYAQTGATWARTVTSGSGVSRFWSVALDSSGNLYLSGYGGGTGGYGFGNGVSVTGPATGLNAFLVKYDTAGMAQKAQGVVSGGVSEYWCVKVDSTGGVYAAGYVIGIGLCDLGSGVTVAGTSPAANVLLVKY